MFINLTPPSGSYYSEKRNKTIKGDLFLNLSTVKTILRDGNIIYFDNILVSFNTEEDAYAAYYDMLVDPVEAYGHLKLKGISDVDIMEEGVK